jgi:hypothetical protein
MGIFRYSNTKKYSLGSSLDVGRNLAKGTSSIYRFNVPLRSKMIVDAVKPIKKVERSRKKNLNFPKFIFFNARTERLGFARNIKGFLSGCKSGRFHLQTAAFGSFFACLLLLLTLFFSNTKGEELLIEYGINKNTSYLKAKLLRTKNSLYDINFNKEGFSLKLKDIEQKPQNLKIFLSDISLQGATPVTPAVYVSGGLEKLNFSKAELSIGKNSEKSANAILYCSEKNFDPQTFGCAKWERTKLSVVDEKGAVKFSARHFSAYIAVHLEVLDVESNLTKGDIWSVRFRTYSSDNLTIEGVDGTKFNKDIEFLRIKCGAETLPINRISISGNSLIVSNYSCDGEISIIENQTITSGRHWLAFTFGDTVKALAHNFACDEGTLDATCNVSSVQTMSNNDLISGTGNLVIQSGGDITSAAGDEFSIAMDGDITIDSGGHISGNLSSLTAANMTVNGTINVNGKGFAGGGSGASQTPTGGEGSGGGSAVSTSYRIPVTINNTSSYALTDYQVLVTINTQTLVDGGKMNSNCSDLRFYDNNEHAPLSYFIEGSCPGTATTVWVKVPSISASSSHTIYATYGNSLLTSQSNADNTFILYDTFDGSSLSSARWNGDLGEFTVSGGVLRWGYGQAYAGPIWGNTNWQYGIVETRFRSVGRTEQKFRFGMHSNGTYTDDFTTNDSFDSTTDEDYSFASREKQGSYPIGLWNTPAGRRVEGDTWYGLKVAHLPSNTIYAYLNDWSMPIGGGDYTFTPDIGKFKLQAVGNINNGSYYWEFDFIKIRNYVTPEPTASLGSETAQGFNIYDMGGGGGGYGGAGGSGATSGVSNVNGGSAYGSNYDPIDLGSGGAGAGYNGTGASGGRGGGRISLNISGTLTINGNITANGQTPSTATSHGAGGGSGGSINILAGTVRTTSGTPIISANGGAGGPVSSGTSGGGGGGGGRTAIYWTSANSLSATVSASGGSGESGASAGSDGTTIELPMPSTVIDPICSTGLNSCTGGGALAIPQEAFVVTSIAGTATTPSGTNLTKVEIAIKDTHPSLDAWFNEASGQFDLGTQTYFDATGSANWTYDTSAISWQINHTYAIYVRAVNDIPLSGIPTVLQYVFVNSPPVVSNVSAFQDSNGFINITYDVTDTESSQTTVYASYDSKTTLNEELSSSDTTAITLASTANLPASGTILINDEIISYTNIVGNDLSGTIVRGANTTIAASHSSGIGVWILGSTLSGDYGVVLNGTSKSIVWTGKQDADGFYSDTASIKIISNDLATSSNIGTASSPSFVLDLKDPDVGVPTGGGSGININQNELTALGNDKINTREATLYLSASDDSSFEMIISESAVFLGAEYEGYSSEKNFSLSSSDGTKTVYAKFKDGKNNVSSSFSDTVILDTTPPDTPVGPFIQDISNSAASEWRIFFNWAKNSESDWYSYDIYRSTDGVEYGLLLNISDINTNYVIDTGLVENQTYYYKVRSEDDIGNASTFTSAKSASCGDNPVDNIAPSISSVTAGTPTSSSVNVAWTTDEVATTSVLYSIDESYSSNQGVEGYSTSHSVTLVGLSPQTTYNYIVRSCDGNFNCSESNPDTFETSGGDTSGPLISSVAATNISPKTATIIWTTDENATSFVEYSTVSGFSSGTIFGDFSLVMDHSITLPSVLSPETTYYYKVRSTDEIGNETVSSQYSFTTADSISDTTGPVITNVTESIISYNTATIGWTTDEPATSFVEFGQTTAFGRTVGSYVLTTSHSIALPLDLTPSTEYDYRVRSTDIYGNETVGSLLSFITSASPNDTTPPVISGVEIGEPAATTVTITWATNEAANSYIDYSLDRSYVLSAGSSLMVTSHSVTLVGLSPSTQYYFRIRSSDPSGNQTVDNNSGSGYSFATASSNSSPPVISNIQIISVAHNTATITWTTDKLADSFVEFGFDENYGRVVGSFSLAINHSVDLPNDLLGKVTYHFRVRSTDIDDNLAVSQNYSFTTPQSPGVVVAEDTTPPVISNVTATLVSTTEAVITWTTDEVSTSQVEWGSTNSYGNSSEEDITLTIQHAVKISGLSMSTTYYYRVISKDASDNQTIDDNSGNGYLFTTASPTVVSSGFSGRDTNPPVITGLLVKDITSNSAVVYWKTDEPANSQVKYGTSPAAYTKTAGFVDSYVREHSVKLSGLSSNTNYFFNITCEDVVGNASVTTSSFKTLPSDDLIEPGDDEPEKPQDPDDEDVDIKIPADPELTEEEKVQINSFSDLIKKGSSAFVEQVFQVILKSMKENPSVKDIDEAQFVDSISELAPKIISQPVISGAKITVSAGPTWARISWVTDKKSNSIVAYAEENRYRPNLSEPYEVKIGDLDEQVTSHEVMLQNLSPNTVYHFEVRSRPVLGSWSKSGDNVFKTESLSPQISDFRFGNISDTKVEVYWKTSLPTMSKLQLTDASSGRRFEYEEASYLRDHKFTLAELKTATSYNLSIISIDEEGNDSASHTIPFSTIVSDLPPIISQVRVNTSLIPGKIEKVQAIITWKTSKPATSRIYFEEGTSSSRELKQSTSIDPVLKTEHVVIATVFKPGRAYRFRAESIDALNNASVSKDFTILTPKPKQTVVELILQNFEQTFSFLIRF